MVNRKQIIYTVVTALLLASSVAHAQRPYSDWRSDNGYNSYRDRNGLGSAVSEAERRTGGRVLSADPRNIDGKQKYRIKVLTPSGRVRILHMDAD